MVAEWLACPPSDVKDAGVIRVAYSFFFSCGFEGTFGIEALGRTPKVLGSETTSDVPEYLRPEVISGKKFSIGLPRASLYVTYKIAELGPCRHVWRGKNAEIEISEMKWGDPAFPSLVGHCSPVCASDDFRERQFEKDLQTAVGHLDEIRFPR